MAAKARRTQRRRIIAVPALAGAVALIGGCGQASTSKLAAEPSITVGTSPSVSNVSLFLALQKGFFSSQKLHIQPRTSTSGSAAFPLLVNGQIAITATDPVSPLVAISHHIPLVIIAQGSSGRVTPQTDPTALVLRADSSLKTAADLRGKTIAVNALSSLSHVGAESAIDNLGGRSSEVKFVELPVPAMIAAVQRHQVDGAIVSEPFTTQAKKSGLRVLLNPVSQGMQSVPQLVYVTTKSFASRYPDVVRRFATSMTQANAELAKNPDEIRTVAQTSTTIPAGFLAKMTLPVFTTAPLKLSAVRRLETYMIKYNVLKSPLNLSEYVVQGS
jgi:NitT/TauT family transport system substrate-binding protein